MMGRIARIDTAWCLRSAFLVIGLMVAQVMGTMLAVVPFALIEYEFRRPRHLAAIVASVTIRIST